MFAHISVKTVTLVRMVEESIVENGGEERDGEGLSNKDEDPVTEKLCESRRQTIQEQINGLKKTIYTVGVTTTLIIVAVEFILTLFR